MMLKRNDCSPSLSTFFCLLGVTFLCSTVKLVGANSTEADIGDSYSNYTLLVNISDTVQDTHDRPATPDGISSVPAYTNNDSTATSSTSYDQEISPEASLTTASTQSVSTLAEYISETSTKNSLQISNSSFDISERQNISNNESTKDIIESYPTAESYFPTTSTVLSPSTETIRGIFPEMSTELVNTSSPYIHTELAYTFRNNSNITIGVYSEVQHKYENLRIEERFAEKSMIDNIFPKFQELTAITNSEGLNSSSLREALSDNTTKIYPSIQVNDVKESNLSTSVPSHSPSSLNFTLLEIILLNTSAENNSKEIYSYLSSSNQSYDQKINYQLEKPPLQKGKKPAVSKGNVENAPSDNTHSNKFINTLYTSPTLRTVVNNLKKTNEIEKIKQNAVYTNQSLDKLNHSLLAQQIRHDDPISDGISSDFTTLSSNHWQTTVHDPGQVLVNQTTYNTGNEKEKNCSLSFEILISDNKTSQSLKNESNLFTFLTTFYPASENNVSEINKVERPVCFSNLTTSGRFYGYLSNTPKNVILTKNTTLPGILLKSERGLIENEYGNLSSNIYGVISEKMDSLGKLASKTSTALSVNQSAATGLPTLSETPLTIRSLTNSVVNKTINDSTPFIGIFNSTPVTYILNEIKPPDTLKLYGNTIKSGVTINTIQNQINFSQIPKTLSEVVTDTSHEKNFKNIPILTDILKDKSKNSQLLTTVGTAEHFPKQNLFSESYLFSNKYHSPKRPCQPTEPSTHSAVPFSFKTGKSEVATNRQISENENTNNSLRNGFLLPLREPPIKTFISENNENSTITSTTNHNDIPTSTSSSEVETLKFSLLSREFKDDNLTRFVYLANNIPKSSLHSEENLHLRPAKSNQSSWTEKNDYTVSPPTTSFEHNTRKTLLPSFDRVSEAIRNSSANYQSPIAESTRIDQISTDRKIFWNLCFTRKPSFNYTSNLDPFKKPLSNEISMNTSSSNIKVFWNLCPTKKPNVSTQTGQPTTEPSDSTSPFSASTILPNASSPTVNFTQSSILLASLLTVSDVETATETMYTSSTEPALEDTTQSIEQTKEDLFPIYWNVPTFQCHKYGFNFGQVSEWGLRQNYQDEFRGDEIVILYDPGEFPALLPAPDGKQIPRNGGVPQEGSLTRHLSLFEGHVDKLIPDVNFSGLAIIDFEHWRPIWRHNWGSLTPYRDFSRLIERKRHPFWFSTMVEMEATYRYELGARVFLLDTLRAGKRLRPRANWGYYGYPFCFNYTPHNNKATCSYEVQVDNDSLFWLFSETTAYYPSLYLKNNDMYPMKRQRFIKGRLDEAMRVAQDVPVYPYVWYKYHDTNQFLSKEDMLNLLKMPIDYSCKGIVIWGASRDVNSREKCSALLSYLNEVIGPIVKDLHYGSFNIAEDGNKTEDNYEELLEKTEEENEDVLVKKANYDIRDFEV